MIENVLIAIVWNEKQADLIDLLENSVSVLNTKNVIIGDDSHNERYRERFYNNGWVVLHEKTDHLPTIEQKIVLVKNHLRDYFLNHNEFSHIFWLEGDIICPPGIIERLLESEKHNITAVRPQHFNIPGVFPFNDEISQDSYKMRGHPCFKVIDWEWLCPSRIERICCYGAGCNLISRSATEKAEFWVKPYSPATHDILYCMDLDLLGYPCYVDTGLLCGHKYHYYTGLDERFDYGGDWSDLDRWRSHTIQWKDKLKRKDFVMQQNTINPDQVCAQAIQAKLNVYKAKEQFESVLKTYNEQLDNMVNVINIMKNRILELENKKEISESQG